MIERSELHDAAQKAFPATDLRPARDASWNLIAEMGWLMVPLPEDAGGLGLGRDAAAAVHFELGRVLCTAPVIPAMLAVQALGASTTLPNRDDWTTRACGGELITIALLPGTGVHGGGSDPLSLSGTLPCVADADMASHVLVLSDNLAALVPLAGDGVSTIERTLWDESRRLFDVVLHGHVVDPALVVARGAETAKMAQTLQTDLAFALAADSLGGANAILDMTVDYLKTRKQFERPLAMFQALKHRCADLKTLIAAAEALLWSQAIKYGITLAQAGALKAYAAEVYRYVCEEAIQLHGGIGLTDEYYCHLFMKRANLNVQLGGDADHWLEARGREAMAAG